MKEILLDSEVVNSGCRMGQDESVTESLDVGGVNPSVVWAPLVRALSSRLNAELTQLELRLDRCWMEELNRFIRISDFVYSRTLVIHVRIEQASITEEGETRA